MRAAARRPVVVLVCLVLAVALFGTAAMTWVEVAVPTTVSQVDVPVRGTDAAPAVSALGLVAGAAAVALTIAGARVRMVVAVIIVLSGAGAAVAAAGAVADPVGVSESSVGQAVGVIGSDAVHRLTPWPWVSLALGALVCVGGAWAAVAARRWPDGGPSRYERGDRQARDAARAKAVDPRDADRRDGIDAWDALSEGRDPTGG